MKYFVHYVKFEMYSLILCKLPILFLTVKPKLGHNFSQFIHRFKTEILRVGLSLFILQVFLNSKRQFAIFEYSSSWTSQFFPIHKKIENWGGFDISLGYTLKLGPDKWTVEVSGELRFTTSYLER